MATIPVFQPGESHGQKRLEGYSPWGCEESDMAEVTEHNCSHHLCPYVTIRGNACFLKCAGPPSCQWEQNASGAGGVWEIRVELEKK